MQQVLTDWLWKIDIKDPKYIKGYSKLSLIKKLEALAKYKKDERESRKLIWACKKFFKSLYEHKDWRSARKRLKEVQELYPKFDWGIFKYRLVYNTDD
jgi:hypothetical protein